MYLFIYYNGTFDKVAELSKEDFEAADEDSIDVIDMENCKCWKDGAWQEIPNI